MNVSDVLMMLKPAIQTLDEYYSFKSIGIDKDKMNFELSIQRSVLKAIRLRDSLTLHRILDMNIQFDPHILMLYTGEAIYYNFLEFFIVFAGKLKELSEENLEMLLFQTIRSGSLDLLEFFLKINSWNSEIKTKSLRIAASSGNESAFKFLISSGFSEIEVKNWFQLFHLACYGESLPILHYLYEQKNSEIELSESELSECLQIVTQKGNKSLFDFLIELGAPIHCRTKRDESLLHCACYKSNVGNYEILEHLFRLGLAIDHKSNVGSSVLYEACRHASLEMIQLLIDKGANINEADLSNETPILGAMWKGRQDVVDLLIRSGADLDRKDKYGMTIRDLAKNLRIDLSASAEASVTTGGSAT